MGFFDYEEPYDPAWTWTEGTNYDDTSTAAADAFSIDAPGFGGSMAGGSVSDVTAGSDPIGYAAGLFNNLVNADVRSSNPTFGASASSDAGNILLILAIVALVFVIKD